MCRIGIVLLSTLLAALLFAGVSMAAGPPDTEPGDLVLEPVVMSSDWSLDEFVLLGYNEKISVEQVNAYLEQLNETQIDELINLMAEQAEFDPEILRAERQQSLATKLSPTDDSELDIQAMAYPVPSLWRQNIEHRNWPNWYLGRARVNTHYVDYECENDFWYDPDKD